MADEQHRTLDLLDHALRVRGVLDGDAAQRVRGRLDHQPVARQFGVKLAPARRVRKRSVNENDGWVSHDQHPPLWSIRHGDGTRGGICVASVK